MLNGVYYMKYGDVHSAPIRDRVLPRLQRREDPAAQVGAEELRGEADQERLPPADGARASPAARDLQKHAERVSDQGTKKCPEHWYGQICTAKNVQLLHLLL